ncbi:hypothetical protein JVT61DRAFT_12172 [Boletus reticuloceps]|uniref:Uncharacterized protein n=1 Tax=Boletus reticuloceps TaxID=495285 RepID=A0A8I2YE97_9AGAM|nr:hypothetical protein JVT61DRAFT_12172 [Boletus reticuloceps]
MAELRSTEHRRSLLISIREHHKHDFEVNKAELQVLKMLLDTKGLAKADVEGVELLQQETCRMELVVTDQEVTHFQDTVKWREQGGWYTPSTFKLNHHDNNIIYRDDSSDNGGDDGELALHQECSRPHHEPVLLLHV